MILPKKLKQANNWLVKLTNSSYKIVWLGPTEGPTPIDLFRHAPATSRTSFVFVHVYGRRHGGLADRATFAGGNLLLGY